MRARSFIAIACITASSAALSATSTYEGLTPIGTGTAKYMGMITLYDATLYSDQQPQPSGWFQNNICLALTYAREIDKDIFAEAAGKILERQHTEAVRAKYQPQLQQLNAAYRSVQKGDRYDFCYRAKDNITRVSLNGEPIFHTEGRHFADYYLGIWLGDNGLSDNLRARLTGIILE